jgi:hypothetical protein
MGFNISQETLAKLREIYKKETRVELLQLDDPFSKIPIGTKGTVKSVDDIGTIHVRWDNGSGLGVVYGEDACRVIEE